MSVQNVWESRMEPFCILGNLYFVGTKPASSHIIDTGDGLIMLDSGYPETLYLVIQSMHELGLDPYDLRYILHSHGHIDHIGGTRALVELTGAKTILGRQDLDYVTGKRDLTFAKELGMKFDCPFTPDILLDDGDEIRLGNTVIRCLHTPGHTEGTFSFFFDVTAHGNTYRVGTHGGVGENSMAKAFLEQYGLPLSLRDDFRNGLHRLRDEKVDVFIGNHQHQCHTLERYQQIKAGKWDAFVDRQAWPDFLDSCERMLDALLARENAG